MRPSAVIILGFTGLLSLINNLWDIDVLTQFKFARGHGADRGLQAQFRVDMGRLERGQNFGRKSVPFEVQLASTDFSLV